MYRDTSSVNYIIAVGTEFSQSELTLLGHTIIDLASIDDVVPPDSVGAGEGVITTELVILTAQEDLALTQTVQKVIARTFTDDGRLFQLYMYRNIEQLFTVQIISSLVV